MFEILYRLNVVLLARNRKGIHINIINHISRIQYYIPYKIEY